MSTELPQLQPTSEKLPVCKLLRTKTAYGGYSIDDVPWDENDSTTAVYWCLGTMETAGPDNVLCHPHTCRHGRGCYQTEPD